MSSLKIVLFSVLLLSSVAVQAAEQCVRPIEVKAGEHILKGCINSSDTATALLNRMPFTVTMANAHNIEMVYRFKEALPAENATRSSYKIGDIFYWTPKMHWLFTTVKTVSPLIICRKSDISRPTFNSLKSSGNPSLVSFQVVPHPQTIT